MTEPSTSLPPPDPRASMSTRDEFSAHYEALSDKDLLWTMNYRWTRYAHLDTALRTLWTDTTSGPDTAGRRLVKALFEPFLTHVPAGRGGAVVWRLDALRCDLADVPFRDARIVPDLVQCVHHFLNALPHKSYSRPRDKTEAAAAQDAYEARIQAIRRALTDVETLLERDPLGVITGEDIIALAQCKAKRGIRV